MAEKPEGATHLQNEKPDDDKIEPSYQPPMRVNQLGRVDDINEEVKGDESPESDR